MISFSTSAEVSGSAEKICDQIFDVSNWHSFDGYGPIPGIEEAVMVSPEGNRLGTRFEVTNRDGSTHVETVTEYKRGEKLKFRMDSFSPPLSKLADHFVESWNFEETDNTTKVVRSFELHPRNIAGRIVLSVISWFLKRAVLRHLSSMKESLAASQDSSS